MNTFSDNSQNGKEQALNIKITSDSTCDLSPEILKKYDIAVIPLTVTLGEKSGHDGIDVTPEDIYAYVDQTGNLPKSSAVSIGEYESFFQTWRDRGYEIIHFNISEKFSASYQHACTAAKEIGGVYVVDSENLSTGQGLMVIHAAEMARSGMNAEEITERCRKLAPQIEASFVVNTIDYLHKGGRCSALAALSANLLHIKPCIEVQNGAMHPGKKYHGNIRHAILSYAEDRLKNRNDINPERMFITHTRCDQKIVDEVKNIIQQYCPEIQEITETTAGATITTHCGPNTLGILFIRK